MKLSLWLVTLGFVGAAAPISRAQDASPLFAPAWLSASQVLEKSRQTYAGFSSYKGSCSAVSDALIAVGDAEPMQNVSSASATIEFVRGERLAVEGVDMGGSPFKALWTPGQAYIEQVKRGDTIGAAGEVKRTDYKNDDIPAFDAMLGGLTGFTGTTGSLLPAALLDNIWSNPFPNPKSQLRQLPARNLGTVPCYVIEATAPELNRVTTYWIERKTFLLRRITEELGEQRFDDMPEVNGVKEPIMRLAYSLNQFVFATTEAK